MAASSPRIRTLKKLESIVYGPFRTVPGLIYERTRTPFMGGRRRSLRSRAAITPVNTIATSAAAGISSGSTTHKYFWRSDPKLLYASDVGIPRCPADAVGKHGALG